MGKFLLLYLIFRLFGHPILGIILLIIIYYFVDRRYVGLLPNVVKPFRQQARTRYLKRQIEWNPHDMSARYDLAGIYLAKKRYAPALLQLEALAEDMKESADVLYDFGVCHLGLGHRDEGESYILRALALQPALRYGEPYVRLAAAFASADPQKSLNYIEQAQQYNISSCETYYRMVQVYRQLGDSKAARAARTQCLKTYHSLPRFRKRHERKWALLASFRG